MLMRNRRTENRRTKVNKYDMIVMLPQADAISEDRAPPIAPRPESHKPAA